MKWIFLSLCLLACACKNEKQRNTEGRELLMTKFFESDTIPGLVDSQDYHIEIFLAYYRNDTTAIAKWLSERQAIISEQKKLKHISVDSTITKYSIINDSTFDEAYQFDYERAFCDEEVSFSIGVNWGHGDSIKEKVSMITVVKSEHVDYENQAVTTVVKTVSRKILSSEEWEAIANEIYYCDLWGLQPDNHDSGLDGSTLCIFGKKRKVRGLNIYDKKNICRWAAENTAVGKLFKNVYKTSGVKVNCFYPF